MGAADVIPGVSGGTVAFITGIYEELINSIKSIDLDAFRLLFSFKLVLFWKKINGNFLICVLAGIVTSLLSLSKLMTYLLEHHPISIWSFFIGLILVSSPLILRDIKGWNFFKCKQNSAQLIKRNLFSSVSYETFCSQFWFSLALHSIENFDNGSAYSS